MKKKIISVALTALIAVSMLAGCGSQPAQQSAAPVETAAAETPAAVEAISGSVATDGSTSMEKVIGALGEAFVEANPEVNFTYNPTGSGSGITAVSEGRCDIGLSSRALKDEETSAGLVGTTLALDGIAIIVSPENPVTELSLEEIAKIYTCLLYTSLCPHFLSFSYFTIFPAVVGDFVNSPNLARTCSLTLVKIERGGKPF